MWNLKYDAKKLIYKTNRLMHTESKLIAKGGNKGGRQNQSLLLKDKGADKIRIWDQQIHSTTCKINHKDVL